ncbi:hypothetical protein TNCV_2110401 [Trichonephila clavipes]|nr:hypothetical protein TNCV_2110401 [Trichonephila clavipes]
MCKLSVGGSSGHSHELVVDISWVRALELLKTRYVEELMHVKYIKARSPSVGIVWKFEEESTSSDVILVAKSSFKITATVT